MLKRLELVFKALGEPTRLKMVRILAEKELCVCEIVACMDISQPRASQHLKVLKKAGIVNERKDKQKSIYSLSKDAQAGSIPGFIQFMNTQVVNLPELSGEWKRFNELENDPKVAECNEARLDMRQI